MAGAFQRLTDQNRTSFEISIDGDKVSVLDGDTVLTAILLHQTQLRQHEISGELRAGFCLMGACQDCWVAEESGRRLRACTSYVMPDLAIVTGKPIAPTLDASVAIIAGTDEEEGHA